ncbi:hypothetical protein EVA_09387 [gut metagenome]|uniref:Uncharacterized protein n=1 Tax=gut metagenome TaxID=749906 RepID=J9GQZ8_9ZZZZ
MPCPIAPRNTSFSVPSPPQAYKRTCSPVSAQLLAILIACPEYSVFSTTGSTKSFCAAFRISGIRRSLGSSLPDTGLIINTCLITGPSFYLLFIFLIVNE